MKKLYYSAILGLLFLVTCPVTAATIHLDKDTSLVPQGWSVADDDLKFKKDTTAELNINGELVKGTLKSDSYLRPTGWKNIINDYYMTETNHLFFPRFFYPIRTYSNLALPAYGHIRYKGNTAITFNEQGLVIEGIIDEPVTISLQNNKYGFISFKEGTLLTFNNTGDIISGTLDKDTKLRPLGWEKNLNTNAGFIEFKKDKKVTFTKNGYVESGTLKNTIQWKKSDDSTITLLKNTLIQFNML